MTLAEVSKILRVKFTPTLMLGAKTIGMSFEACSMSLSPLSVKPVVPITIDLPESLQTDKALREASGLEKSIRTSKSFIESIKLSPLSKPAAKSDCELELIASISASPIFPFDPLIAILVIDRVL